MKCCTMLARNESMQPCKEPASARVQGGWFCAAHAKRLLDLVKTRWAVNCPVHGLVYLTRGEYDAQMNRPDAAWTCPVMDGDPARFGLCGYASEWDDATYDEAEGCES